jgi:Mg/Co/Ni transporter MgtE
VESKVKLIAQLQKASLTKKENAKFIAKSLLNLDEEKLSPIVNKLNNKQLMAIYNTASNMQRQKLLQSLTPDKAADIVKKVML